jgi:hypothetical protein
MSASKINGITTTDLEFLILGQHFCDTLSGEFLHAQMSQQDRHIVGNEHLIVGIVSDTCQQQSQTSTQYQRSCTNHKYSPQQ